MEVYHLWYATPLDIGMHLRCPLDTFRQLIMNFMNGLDRTKDAPAGHLKSGSSTFRVKTCQRV